MAVVDYDRMKRLYVPDTPALSFGTKVYIVLMALCIIFLIKKWRDKKLSSSKAESESSIIYP